MAAKNLDAYSFEFFKGLMNEAELTGTDLQKLRGVYSEGGVLKIIQILLKDGISEEHERQCRRIRAWLAGDGIMNIPVYDQDLDYYSR
jgi:hypothetical protein